MTKYRQLAPNESPREGDLRQSVDPDARPWAFTGGYSEDNKYVLCRIDLDGELSFGAVSRSEVEQSGDKVAWFREDNKYFDIIETRTGWIRLQRTNDEWGTLIVAEWDLEYIPDARELAEALLLQLNQDA
jgi:hypothetical protein